MKTALCALSLLLVSWPAQPQEAKPSDPKQDPKKDDKVESSKLPKEQDKPWREWCCYEKGRVERGELVTVVFDMHHTPHPGQPASLNEFARLLTPYLTAGKGRIEASDSLNTLAVTDTKENIKVLEQMIRLIHHAEPPILIEAKVVEVRWSKELQIGIEGDLSALSSILIRPADSESFFREWRVKLNPQDALIPGVPFQGSTFKFGRTSQGSGSSGALLQTFQSRGRAQILSQPRVIVKADETANIFAGEEIPYPAEILVHPGGTNTTLRYKQSGVKLSVTPHMSAPGTLLLKIIPEVTTVVGFVQISSNTQAPQFTVRTVTTELIVRDGEEVVIGGLYRKEKIVQRRGLPFLMDIPVLGYLFGRYEEDEVIQEILFYIKPTIIKDESLMPRDVFDPDKK